jgi:lipopolysaccharide export system protein LptC
MLKRVIVLAILLSILLMLFLVKSQTNTPVINQGNDSSEYKMEEYKISKIIENQYYGKSEDGTKIVFSAESIDSSVKIQVDDVVIVFFEKDNVGKGLVKVEKK